MTDRLASHYRTAADDLRYQGLTVVLWKMLAALVKPVFKLELHILLDFDLAQPIREPRARVDADYRVELATEADLQSIVDLQVPPPPSDMGLSDAERPERAQVEERRAESERRFREAMQAGEKCFLFRIGDELIHFNWMCFSTTQRVGARPVELEPGEVYTTDGVTAERGRGVHGAVNAAMLRYAKEHGEKRALTIIDITKATSRRGIVRLGWRRRGRILYITRRNHRTWMLRLGGDVEPMFRAVRRAAAEP